MEPKPQVISPFTGLKLVAPEPLDPRAGGETGVPTVARNVSGDWRTYDPTNKTQLMILSNGAIEGDTESCTDFSGTNNIAIQLDWLIKNGQVDPNGVNFLESNGYLDENGRVNLSPRFTAVMSGTTPQAGNTLPNVWKSMSTDGVVPETVWPMPTAGFDAIANNPPFTAPQSFWNEYFATVSPEAIALGKQFLQWFSIQYEWIAWPGGGAQTMADFAALMPVAPLQIATAVCNGWNTEDPILGCGIGSQHATTLVNVEVGTAYDILDHYNPFLKQFAPDYSISYAMRGVISSVPQNAKTPPPFTYNYQTNLELGSPAGAEVTALQTGLQTLLSKTGAPYMKPGVFGPFGPQTENALGRFQVDHGIADTPQGYHFGPKSRAALTEALKALSDAASSEPLPRPLNPGSTRPN